MQIVKSLARMQQLKSTLPRPVVLVPTMGALHEGHLALVNRAKKLAGQKGFTVATIFVNPTQFGPTEDLSRYPRDSARDCALMESVPVEVVFAPEASERTRRASPTWSRAAPRSCSQPVPTVCCSTAQSRDAWSSLSTGEAGLPHGAPSAWHIVWRRLEGGIGDGRNESGLPLHWTYLSTE